MNLQLKDKVALLVGATGTIGAACAELLAAEGARVVIADLPSSLQHSNLEGVPIDVTEESSVRACVEQVIRDFGRIDVAVVLAGIFQGSPISEITADDWDRVLAVNLKGTFLVCREVLPHMQQGDYGRIICIASLAGQVGGIAAGANYAASKAGVLSLVKSVAKQSQQPWITVNAINPGPVEGTMTSVWSEAMHDRVRSRIPLGRYARPEEIAAAVAFLASPQAAFIHGAHLDVNGGLYMD